MIFPPRMQSLRAVAGACNGNLRFVKLFVVEQKINVPWRDCGYGPASVRRWPPTHCPRMVPGQEAFAVHTVFE